MILDLFKLEGKTALVTGASRGLGREIALALGRAGTSVVVTDILLEGEHDDPEKLAAYSALAGHFAGNNTIMTKQTAREIEEMGSRAVAKKLDVTDPAGIERVVRETESEFGSIDILVSNAAVMDNFAKIEDQKPELWERDLRVNLTGAFLCTQEAVRIMKSQVPRGGRIINNGSISAHAPRPNSAPYTATKHAITGLTKSTSRDGRKYDIACGQIDIGNAATEITSKIGTGAEQADGTIAPEPLMDLSHVASAVLYMASLPLDTNVQFLTIMATKMPFIGRG